MAKSYGEIRVFNVVTLETEELPAGYVSSDDAARYLRVAPQTIRRMIERGDIVAVPDNTSGRFGWRWLINTSELMAYKKSVA